MNDVLTAVALAILRVSAPEAESSDLTDHDLDEARAALHAVANTLDVCETCGKPHTPHPATYPAADGTRYEGISWADPNDGHPLRRRSTALGDSQIADWLRARGNGDRT